MHKQWVKRLLFILSIALISVCLINIFVDPYGVFYKNPNTCKEPNERYTKIKILSNNKTTYNGFLMGSSRIGTTEPKILEQYLSDIHFYNLTISAGTLTEFEKIIQYMLGLNIHPKVIYLQIDIYDNLINSEQDPSKLLLRMNLDSTYKSKILFYKDYLFMFSKKVLFEQFKFDYKLEKPSRKYDFYNTGCWYEVQKEKLIQNNPDEYIKNEPSFHQVTDTKLRINQKAMSENLNSLKNIIAECKQKNIRLIVFITPHNHNMLDTINFNNYAMFLKQIVLLTDYWDFSGYNTVTNNDNNYYEFSHYRPYVAKLIAARIFNDKKISVPSDFGEYVNKNNILKHIEHLNVQK